MLELNDNANHKNLIKDGDESTFGVDVIEASHEVPVIVDFWAPWCGPCKTLGPALESAVKAANGKVKMVKIDVDQSQQIATQLQIKSIPTVYGFFEGKPVDAFQGAQSESEIKKFIDKLISLSGNKKSIMKKISWITYTLLVDLSILPCRLISKATSSCSDTT